jgi:CRISPR-associated protein Cmx8
MDFARRINKMPKKELKEITLDYNLQSLPSAQHRAGLAGLFILIKSMRNRGLGPLPEYKINDSGNVSITLNQESLTALFNDLFDASYEEKVSNTIRKKKKTKEKIPPKREEKQIDDKGKEKTIYIYDDVVPKGEFIGDMPQIWLKLWRDAIWEIIRSKPTTRNPYNSRAKKEPFSLSKTTFNDLYREKKVELKNSLYLGAESIHADKIKFTASAKDTWLLNFWHIVMKIFVPESIDRDGKRTFNGYVLAIPDIIDLEGFFCDFPETISILEDKKNGYRPKDSVISIPAEGALEYLYSIMKIAKARYGQGEIAYNVSGVEIFHMEKRGNSVHTLSSDRLSFDPDLLNDYENVRKRYWNPIFQRQVIINILKHKPWYTGFNNVFAIHNRELFLGGKSANFCSDVNKKFYNN